MCPLLSLYVLHRHLMDSVHHLLMRDAVRRRELNLNRSYWNCARPASLSRALNPALKMIFPSLRGKTAIFSGQGTGPIAVFSFTHSNSCACVPIAPRSSFLVSNARWHPNNLLWCRHKTNEINLAVMKRDSCTYNAVSLDC